MKHLKFTLLPYIILALFLSILFLSISKTRIVQSYDISVTSEPTITYGYNVGDIHPTQGWVIECQEDDPCWNCHKHGNQICGEDYIQSCGTSFISPKQGDYLCSFGVDMPFEDYLPCPLDSWAYWIINTFVKEVK